jgi:phosphocarrier protein
VTLRRVERTLTVRNALGLHARAAAALVKSTGKFSCEVMLEKDGQEVNGKSIMGVLMLAAAQGSEVKVRTEGPDAEEAMAEIEGLFARGFYGGDTPETAK